MMKFIIIANGPQNIFKGALSVLVIIMAILAAVVVLSLLYNKIVAPVLRRYTDHTIGTLILLLGGLFCLLWAIGVPIQKFVNYVSRLIMELIN